MDVVIGLVGWVLAIWAVVACTRRVKTQSSARSTRLAASRTLVPRPAARTPVPRPTGQRPPAPPDRIGDPLAGWLIGHQVAQGHDGFPGDPLPDGHLGSPSNLAFWGSVFDDDDPDEDW